MDSFPFSTYAFEHYQRTEQYASLIAELFRLAVEDAARLSERLPATRERLFTFQDYPELNRAMDQVLNQMTNSIGATVIRGVQSEWIQAEGKYDALVRQLFPDGNVPPIYNARNVDALQAFTQRKTAGLRLSDRVFKYTGQFKNEIENSLTIGLARGESAIRQAARMNEYLQYPDLLGIDARSLGNEQYRNQLLIRIANQSPGQGVYKSAYKNALRMTRTEINNAYRTADHERYQQLDFVVGIEVKRSRRIYDCEVCGPLAGKYPKTFKFSGWHPSCRCFVVTILATKEEIDELIDKVLRGEDASDFASVNAIKTPHQGFANYISGNSERLLRAKNPPYFIRDNFKGGIFSEGLKLEVGG